MLRYAAEAAAIALCLAAPLLPPLQGGADAVTRATWDVPETPSGRFLILLNLDRHAETAEAWRAFLREEPVGVIMEDLVCVTAVGDGAAEQLAQRYQARLAENQLVWRQEDPLLLASKADWGLLDAAILSAEWAEAYHITGGEGLEAISLGEASP